MEQTVKDRILIYIKETNSSQSKFEKSAGLSNGYINNLKSSPSTKILQKIISSNPSLNKDWLITGEGDMISENDKNSSEEVTMSREVFDTISKLTETVLTQQRTIESMQNTISRTEQMRELSGPDRKKKEKGIV